MQQQHAGTTMILEFNVTTFSSHINNKLEQQHRLQPLDILKCSAWQHQITKWDLTYHQIHFNT
eukprot:1013055-Amphidinium_carterae.1